MTGIILAGGKASRMGNSCDKAFLEIGSEHIIDMQCRVFKNIFGEIIVVTNSPEKYKDLKGIVTIPDSILGIGPIGGIYSGLSASSSFYNFVVACDMPFINERLIRYMLRNNEGCDVFVPKIGHRFHPLFGIYSKNCISVIAEMAKRSDFRIKDLYPKVKSRFLSKREMEKFDKGSVSLTNINTMKDYEACLSVQ